MRTYGLITNYCSILKNFGMIKYAQNSSLIELKKKKTQKARMF